MTELAGFLRNYRRVVRIALATAGLCSLIAAPALFLLAPVERTGTIPFRLLFDGAAQSRYPNGTAFSPTEIIAPSVLIDVFEANDLKRFGDVTAFEQSMFILGANPDMTLLTEEYEARLSNNRLTPVDRARIEEDFRTRRAALVDPIFSVNMRKSRSLADVPRELTEKILRDTLATWAEHAHTRKGATRYNIPILSRDILDRSIIEREDYFIAIDILRAKTHRVMGTIETLADLPGAHIIRIGPQRISLAEIRSNLEDVIRFRLEPLLDLLRSEGITKDARALRLYSNNQLFQLRLDREESTTLVRSLQRSLDSYTAQRSSSETRDPQITGGARETSTTAPVVPQLDQSFLDRLMSFSTAADDQQYRRDLTDRIIQEGERTGRIQREEAYYQDLAKNLSIRDASAESPATMALIKTRTTQAFDEVSQAAEHVYALYEELSSQNLRASMPLYTTTEEYALRTRRGISSRTLGFVVFLLFVLTFASTLAVGWLRHRFTGRGTVEFRTNP